MAAAVQVVCLIWYDVRAAMAYAVCACCTAMAA